MDKRPRRFKPTDTICKIPSCGGTLFNVTSRLAEAIGVINVKCDRCGKTFGAKVATH